MVTFQDTKVWREAIDRFGPNVNLIVRRPEDPVFVVNVGLAFGYGKTWWEAMDDCRPILAKWRKM